LGAGFGTALRTAFGTAFGTAFRTAFGTAFGHTLAACSQTLVNGNTKTTSTVNIPSNQQLISGIVVFPSFDGKIWRLHSGEEIVWTEPEIGWLKAQEGNS
jgi:predicted cupin superfamily sugar epimerase